MKEESEPPAKADWGHPGLTSSSLPASSSAGEASARSARCRRVPARQGRITISRNAHKRELSTAVFRATPTVRQGILAHTTPRFWIIFDGADFGANRRTPVVLSRMEKRVDTGTLEDRFGAGPRRTSTRSHPLSNSTRVTSRKSGLHLRLRAPLRPASRLSASRSTNPRPNRPGRGIA
jgi:hypothetical protein